MAELIYRTLRENIADIIRKRIIYQELEPGQKIVEQDLAKEFKTSRAPIREALRQLELEGLVNIIPNKGAYVTGISDKDVHDIYMIRSMLEGLCARWATQSITAEQLDSMEETLCLSEYHTSKKNYEKLYELDSLFHEQLYEAGGSRILNHILSDFHDYVKMVRKATISTSSRSVTSTEEHRAIFEAIKEKDPDKAEALAKEHVKHTIESIQAYGLEKIL